MAISRIACLPRSDRSAAYHLCGVGPALGSTFRVTELALGCHLQNVSEKAWQAAAAAELSRQHPAALLREAFSRFHFHEGGSLADFTEIPTDVARAALHGEWFLDDDESYLTLCVEWLTQKGFFSHKNSSERSPWSTAL